MIVSLIVAMTDQRVIGIENRLPWHLPGDMQWFRRHTLGKPVIMGRKTYESIGRALPERTNIVISRDADYRAEGCTVVRSPEEALAAAGDVPEVMVMGGASIYAHFLAQADRLYLTLVHAAIDGDAFFPEFDQSAWREVEREERAPDQTNPYPYSFTVRERIA
jgi:dihydrofolate reductase